MGKPRILAIDDEVGFVELVKSYFEPRGYEIDVALRGAKGIEMAVEKKPDVILLDLKMPGIDGDEFLSLLRSKDQKSRVIFITAYDDGGKTKARLLNSGAYAYFDKPISSLKALEEAVLNAHKEA
ncbi:two-component system response regulator [Candidatus Omnitrophota bacterium]